MTQRKLFLIALSTAAAALTFLAPAALADGAVRLLAGDGPPRLALGSELGVSWNDVHVARLVARSAALQRSLPAAAPGPELEVELDDGCSLLLIDLEKAGAVYATKIAACRDAANPSAALEERLAMAGMMTSKSGSRIEIRPLRSPTVLALGTDLPVRIYLDNAPQAGVEVVAYEPGGGRQARTTDAVGAANLKIGASGPWVVRYRAASAGAELVAELRFEVPTTDFWDAVPPLVPDRREKPRAKADTGEWRELGPAPLVAGIAHNTGRASSIVAPAGRPNRYYLGGASGGVWESVDGGASWTSLNGPLPILSIGALAVDPRNDKVIYAGSGEANYAYHSLYGLGLYRTFNRGRTWRVLAPELFSGRTFSRLVVSPHDNRVVWAAVARAGGTFQGIEGAREHPQREGRMGVFRSRDRGVTWEHLRASNGLYAFAASDIDLDPIDPARVYVAMGDVFGRNLNGVYRSTDGGETFEPVLTQLSQNRAFGRVSLAVAPADPNRLYALVTNPAVRSNSGGFAPSGGSVAGLYRSDDGGDTWTLSLPANFMGQQGHYDSTVAVAPDDPDTVFVGGVQMLRSTDAGQSFVDVTPIHVDHHDMTFDAAGRLLVANDGGVNRSDDLGQTWTTLNQGLGLVQIYPGLSLDPTNPNVVLAGMQDNGTNLRFSDSLTWTSIFGGDGGHTAINPDDPNVMFVEFQGTGNLFRSTNGGLFFEESSTGIAEGDRNCFLPPMVFDPGDSNRLLYATQRIYESTDGGVTWRPISGDLTGGPPFAVRALVIAPSSSNVVYAMTNDGRVLVSSNGGANWELVLEDIAGWPRVTRQIAVDPARPSQAYVADMGFGAPRLLATRDRGRSWEEIGGGLPAVPVSTVAVHRQGSRRLVFAGTDAGVFLSRDFGATWEAYGTLPTAPVMDLVVDARYDRLVASTLGRGAWSIALP